MPLKSLKPKTHYQIALRGVERYVPVGYYEIERTIGTKLLIDVVFTPKLDALNEANAWVNYETLLNAVLEATAEPAELLEEVCDRIYNALKSRALSGILEINITKPNPAMGLKVGATEVRTTYVLE